MMTTLTEHITMITTTTSQLKLRLHEIDNKIRILSQGVRISDDVALDRSRLEEERESTVQCLRICTEAFKNAICRMQELYVESGAKDKNVLMRRQVVEGDGIVPSVDAQNSGRSGIGRVHVFEDVLAAQDSHQVILAAPGDLISAVRVTAKVGATQWIGQVSSNTFEKLLQDPEVLLCKEE